MLSNKPIHITEHLPKSLDDIIRAHRDQCSLALATEEEFMRLAESVARGSVRNTLYRWQILAFHCKAERKLTETYHLVGYVRGARKYRMTSRILAIDLKARRVQTENSAYGLWGKPGTEADIDLNYVCATLNYWGVGQRLGVPELFF